MSWYHPEACFNGPSCRYLAEGRCKFWHPAWHFKQLRSNFPRSGFNRWSNTHTGPSFQEKKKEPIINRIKPMNFIQTMNGLGDMPLSKSKEMDKNQKIIFEKFKESQQYSPAAKVEESTDSEFFNISSCEFDSEEFSSYGSDSNGYEITSSQQSEDSIDDSLEDYDEDDSEREKKVGNNDRLVFLSNLIRYKTVKDVKEQDLREFMRLKNLCCEASKYKMWVEARMALGLPIADQDLALATEKQSKSKLFEDKRTDEFTTKMRQNFVVPAFMLKTTTCYKYRIPANTFGQDKTNMNMSELKDVGSDFAIGLSAPKRLGKIVFYSPKKMKVLAFFGQLNGTVDFGKPLTDYFDDKDPRTHFKIFSQNGKVIVLQKETGFDDFALDREWGFRIDSGIYCAAWDSLLEFLKQGFESLNSLENDLKKRFLVALTRYTVRKLSNEELKKACIERGLIKGKGRVTRQCMIQKLLRVL